MERFRIKITILWCLIQFYWLSRDQLIRDGDEEGHVGAAEIVRDQISEEGWLSFFLHTWWQDLGEYPPIYASFLGAWWKLLGTYPEDILVRSFGIFILLLSALITSEVTRKKMGDYHLCFLLMLFFPLSVSLSRHYMIENMLLLWTSACVWISHHFLEKNIVLKGLCLGFCFAMGMLCKQTFLIGGIGFIALFCLSTELIWIIPTILICVGGWYVPHLAQQHEYLSSSVIANSVVSPVWHLLGPIGMLFWDILGPIGSIGLLLSIYFGYKDKSSRPFLIWLLVSLVICILIPKKYPRVLLCLSIPSVVFLANHLPKRYGRLVGLGCVVWAIYGSFFHRIPSPMSSYIDPDRCPQVWMRPPFPYDMGMARIAKEIQKYPQDTAIRLSKIPDISCSTQTTHNFPYHMEIYLRRHGLQNTIVISDDTNPNSLLLTWEGPIEDPKSLIIQ